MEQEIKPWRRPGKGRPRNEDRGQVLTYVDAHLLAGGTLCDLAEKGLQLLSYGTLPKDGTERPVQRRLLKGKTFGRNIRTYRSEAHRGNCLALSLDYEARKKGLTITRLKTRYIGIREPKPLLSFPNTEPLDSGRPKKKR